MKTPYLFVFLLLVALTGTAQHSGWIKLYRVHMNTSTNDRIEGILYDVTDSTVRYTPNRVKSIRQLRNGELPEVFDVHQSTIDRLMIRRKGHVGRGILIGGSLGLVVGLASAAAPAPTNGLEALGRATLTVGAPIAGVIYGALISLIPYKVKRIQQNKTAFRRARPELKRLSFVYQQQTHLRR